MQATNKNRVKSLESEVIALRKSLDMTKKDPKVWQKLDELGQKISQSWSPSTPSWKLVSEMRR